MNYELLLKTLFKDSQKSIHYKIQEAVSQRTKINENKNYYGYIPSSAYSFLPVLMDLVNNSTNFKEKKFMDIGCGNPIIPLLFDILGCKESKGLEYEKFYILLDQQYDGDKKLIEGDLLTYDFKNWDILYSYNPIKDKKTMEKGLINIMKTMKKGAIFYFNPAIGIDEKIIKKFTRIANGYIYKYTKE